MGQLNETLTETNAHLGELVTLAKDTLKFVKQLAWWSVLVIGVVWPAAGKIISGLPPLPT